MNSSLILFLTVVLCCNYVLFVDSCIGRTRSNAGLKNDNIHPVIYSNENKPLGHPLGVIHYPSWPEKFYYRWTEVQIDNNTNPFPLPNDGYPRGNIRMGSGITYYDSSLQATLEQHDDFCLDIFSVPNDFTCQFLNARNLETYLIMNQKTPKETCCIFPATSSIPRNFVRKAPIWREARIMDRSVRWYDFNRTSDAGGPFAYGFYEDNWTPAGFYFATVHGMAQHYFYNFTENVELPANIFDPPASCQHAQPCTVFPYDVNGHEFMVELDESKKDEL